MLIGPNASAAGVGDSHSGHEALRCRLCTSGNLVVGKICKCIAIGHAGIWDLSWEELAVREALRRSRKPARTPTLVSEDDGRMVREENA